MEILRGLAERSTDHDPVAVPHAGRRHGPANTGTARVSLPRRHRFFVYLADLYTSAVPRPACTAHQTSQHAVVVVVASACYEVMPSGSGEGWGRDRF